MYKSPGLLFLAINAMYNCIWNLLIYKSPRTFINKKLVYFSFFKVLFLFFWANDDTGSLSGPRTTDTQWRHNSKKCENLGQCGRQNMLRPYLKMWEWELIFGLAVKAISSPGVRSPCFGRWKTNHHLRKIQVWNWIKMVSGRKAGFEKWRQGCELGRAHSTTRWSDKKVKTGSAYNYVWI